MAANSCTDLSDGGSKSGASGGRSYAGLVVGSRRDGGGQDGHDGGAAAAVGSRAGNFNAALDSHTRLIVFLGTAGCDPYLDTSTIFYIAM